MHLTVIHFHGPASFSLLVHPLEIWWEEYPHVIMPCKMKAYLRLVSLHIIQLVS